MSAIVEKYILYGASFNPPHIGHFSAISQMLEQYDKVIIFPYPKKHINGTVEVLPPIKQRMKMLEIFVSEYFPQIHDRLCLEDFTSDMGLKDRIDEGILHTYDYLQHVKNKIPDNAHLSVCLGFEAQVLLRKEIFFRQDDIENEFGVFKLEEENTIKSENLRSFFSNHKNIKSAKDEQYIRSAVGNSLAEHIFEHNLYGLKKKANKNKIEEISNKPKKMGI